MLKIYNIKEKQKYIREVAELTQKEWGLQVSTTEEFNQKIDKKMFKIITNLDSPLYCKLILLDGEILIGFISIFPKDGDERTDLSPWYSTMFVKKEYRGKGYSKILNDAIFKEAKSRGFKRLYHLLRIIQILLEFYFLESLFLRFHLCLISLMGYHTYLVFDFLYYLFLVALYPLYENNNHQPQLP